MNRAAVFAVAALCASAICAEEAKPPLAVYRDLLRLSSVRGGFSCSTNGAEAAAFAGEVFAGQPIWDPDLKDRLAELADAKISVASTMVGDRVDFAVSGDVPAESGLGKELAAVKSVDPGLLRFVPANASVVYASSVRGDSPLDRYVLMIRAELVEPLRAMMPPRATYRDFVAFAAPARKGPGIALVVVFRLASAVPPLDELDGKKVATLFTLEKPKPADDQPPDGYSRYRITSSFKNAIGIGADSSDEASQMLRLASGANCMIGPMTLECTCSDGYVFFEVGPEGDLKERLDRPDSRTFSVNTLLPLLRPGLSADGIRTMVYASPSATSRRTLSGLGSLLKPVKAGLAPDGDGLSGVTVALPGGEFTWGWSATRSELEALEKNKGIVQNTIRTILLHGFQRRAFDK